MEHSKEFYQKLIKVIEYLLNVDRSINNDKGREIAGDYWGDIVNFFRNHRGGYIYSRNYIGVKDREALESLLSECRNHVADIEKTEKDRQLNNKGIKVAIWCGIGGLVVAIISLVFSIIAISK